MFTDIVDSTSMKAIVGGDLQYLKREFFPYHKHILHELFQGRRNVRRHYCWAKSLPYEGAARIPFMLYAPERFGIRPQTVIDNPAGLEDIMPTVLEMAGVDIPDTVDGQSLLPLMQGKEVTWRPYIQIECGGRFQCLTDGREKFVWFTNDGSEQFFDLVEDLPREIGKRMRDGQQEGFISRGEQECRNLITAPERAERIAIRRSRWLLFAWWRGRLVEELKGRKEGFSDGERLIPRPKAG